MNRSEIARLTDVELQVACDSVRSNLNRAWSRGEQGSLHDVFALSLMMLDSAIRGIHLHPLPPEGWMTLFEDSAK